MLPAGEVFRFTINYAASTNRDLHIDLFDASTNFLAGALQPVPPGSGIRDMTISYPGARPGEYFVTTFITPTGQSWEQAVAWSAERRITVVGSSYHQWIESHWGVVLENDAINPPEDPDGDGAGNADEFVALTDPRNAADVLKTAIIRTKVGLAVNWPSKIGCNYQLYATADFNVWTPVAASIAGTGEVIRVPLGSTGGAEVFYRVLVAD